LRITYQKALTAAALLNQPLPEDPSGQLGEQRNAVMASLADLNEKLLEVRTALVLPGTDVPELGKRKRGDDTVDEAYIVSAAQDSLGLVDA
jgi:protein AATF/BFR2